MGKLASKFPRSQFLENFVDYFSNNCSDVGARVHHWREVAHFEERNKEFKENHPPSKSQRTKQLTRVLRNIDCGVRGTLPSVYQYPMGLTHGIV